MCEKTIKYCSVFFILVACVRCGNNTAEIKKERIFKGYAVALDSIIKTPDGIIHGLELGAKTAGVKAVEVVNPTEVDEGYSYYEYKVDSITSYTIAFTFVNDTLDEIELQVNCKNPDLGAVILNDLKNYYQKKYTAPVMDKGIFVYNCFDSRKRSFTISLTDNSGIDNTVINILIYREK
jgi:hypothetical protein